MTATPGVIRGLDACSTPTGVFAILALDHRQNLRRELRPDDPSSVPDEALVEFKLAAIRHLSGAATATLLDPEYGLPSSILEHALPGSAGLIVAVEQTGYDGTRTDRISRILDGWSVEKIKRSGASAAKLLIYYNPQAGHAAQQEELVAEVHGACQAADLPLYLEVITFAIGNDERLSGDRRREVVIAAAARLTQIGGHVLKVEFPYDATERNAVRWSEACAELDAASTIPWVLLSGGVEHDLFVQQVVVACEAGASGIVAGRSVWAGSAQLGATERDRYLGGEAVRRLGQLTDAVDRLARPWRSRDVVDGGDRPISTPWYAGY